MCTLHFSLFFEKKDDDFLIKQYSQLMMLLWYSRIKFWWIFFFFTHWSCASFQLSQRMRYSRGFLFDLWSKNCFIMYCVPLRSSGIIELNLKDFHLRNYSESFEMYDRNRLTWKFEWIEIKSILSNNFSL